jgi:hypothetical protein
LKEPLVAIWNARFAILVLIDLVPLVGVEETMLVSAGKEAK